MKKVTAFVGAARKKFTYDAVSQFLDSLKPLGDVETEIVRLSDYRLGTCRGCKVCFMKGEAFCPLKDDRDVLIEKMMASDGVVFATPNYSFHVSALLKIFLDRLGFVFHRPRFFGKTFTSIIAQGFYGGDKIERYLDFVGEGLGFNTVKGMVFTALEPMTEKEKKKQDKALAEISRRFTERLMKPAYPAPTYFWLMAFRGSRASVRWELGENDCDYVYYKDKGWLTSEYFYPVRLGPIKKLTGRFIDALANRKGKKHGRGGQQGQARPQDL
jgi:multimeric flavodoxin WrbA